MKLYPPIYPGDSILRPGTVPGESISTAWEALAFRAPIVRSNMRAASVPESRIDIAVIEQQARAARNVWIGNELKQLYRAWARKFL